MLFLALLISFVGADLTCPCGYSQGFNNVCYKIYPDSYSRPEAYSLCTSDGATLVEFSNAFSSTFVKNMTSELDSFWIGTTCKDSTTSSCLYDTGNSVFYEEFKGGKPDQKKGGPCVMFHPKIPNSWTSERCYQRAAVVCQFNGISAAIQCPTGYSVFAGGYCYKAIEEADQASQEAVCSGDGGHLVSIHSTGENTYVSDLVTTFRPSATSFRIGMTVDSRNSDHWLDGTKVDYKHFSSTSGTASCVQSSLNHSPDGLTWSRADCGNTVVAVCKHTGTKGTVSYPLECPTTTTPSTTTSITTTTTTTASTTTTTTTSKPITTTKTMTTTPKATTTKEVELTSGCNEGLLVGEGEIWTRYYPMDYRNNEYCLYSLAASSDGKKIELKFEDFDTENVYDTVSTFDGPDIQSPLISKLSGRKVPFVLNSTGNRLTVLFQSDPANRFRGFRAVFRTI